MFTPVWPTPLADLPALIVEYSKELTVTVLLLALVVAMLKGWLVPWWVYSRLNDENRRLREENQILRDLGRHAVDTAKELADKTDGGA